MTSAVRVTMMVNAADSLRMSMLRSCFCGWSWDRTDPMIVTMIRRLFYDANTGLVNMLQRNLHLDNTWEGNPLSDSVCSVLLHYSTNYTGNNPIPFIKCVNCMNCEVWWTATHSFSTTHPTHTWHTSKLSLHLITRYTLGTQPTTTSHRKKQDGNTSLANIKNINPIQERNVENCWVSVRSCTQAADAAKRPAAWISNQTASRSETY